MAKHRFDRLTFPAARNLDARDAFNADASAWMEDERWHERGKHSAKHDPDFDVDDWYLLDAIISDISDQQYVEAIRCNFPSPHPG